MKRVKKVRVGLHVFFMFFVFNKDKNKAGSSYLIQIWRDGIFDVESITH